MNIPLLKFLEATKKMRVCTPCSTVLGGHQLGWSLGNEFSGERFGTSACLSERSRLAQKGPRFKSFFSDTFFFRKKKQAKRSDGLCVHHLFRCSDIKDTKARVMSLPLMEQLKARFALQEMCKMLREVFEETKQWSFNPELPIWGNFEGFPLFFGAIFGLAWPYENTIDRTYRLFDRFISLHSFEAWHWGIIQLHQFFVWLTSVGVPFFGTWSWLIVSSLISPKTIWSWVPAKRKEYIQRSKSGHDNQLHHVMLWQLCTKKIPFTPYIFIYAHTLFRHPSRL